MEDRWYLAALLRCPQVGSVRMQRLQSVCPAAKDIWSMTAAELRATGVLTDAAADALARHIQGDPNLPERIAEDCRRADVSMVTMEDECYPLVLREIFDPPLVLYYRGTLLPDARRIGIVGARKFSGYGEAAALEFAEHLTAAGVTVVSGAARGIDTRAHRGALNGCGSWLWRRYCLSAREPPSVDGDRRGGRSSPFRVCPRDTATAHVLPCTQPHHQRTCGGGACR